MKNGSLYWHYTTANRLRRILDDGYIRRASANVPRGERRAVWFTSRDTWEPTASKLLVTPDGSYRTATVPEMVDACGALVRLVVDVSVARYSWDHHRRFGQIDPRAADALESSATDAGSDPGCWRLRYRDVPLTEIVMIETSTDGLLWMPVDEMSNIRNLSASQVDTRVSTNASETRG